MLVDESLEMIVDESLNMIDDESFDMIVDEPLMVEDKSLEKLVDETLKHDEEHFESVITDFAQILDIPCEGACAFADKWSLDELAYGVPTDGGNRDHVSACLCYMLYCVVHSEKFNLAYFMAKRMKWVTRQKRLILPYGMLLTHLFKVIMNENPELNNESYVLYDRVMNPLAAQQERKPRKDRGTRRGRHSTSSSAFDQPSSSHLNDDDDYDDGNGEGTSRASTPSPIRYVN
ncbi:hypothetical protein Tco_0991180 [Tanacetum coccineum]|uniref:Pentatricopeptide repeat-containing protein n=1 Tax=Tanacetum coccineum TaxID=301880 RepID=A0ABQ5EYI7_9ASTR